MRLQPLRPCASTQRRKVCRFLNRGCGWLQTIVTSLSKLLAIPFVSMVPANIHLAKEDTRRSRAGAVFLALTLFGGIAWSVGTTLWKLSGGSE